MSPYEIQELRAIASLLHNTAERLENLTLTSLELANNPTPMTEVSKTLAQVLRGGPQARYVEEIEADAPTFVMTADQERAWAKIGAWLKTDKPFFLLKGVAGSGKSFLMQKVCQASDAPPVSFTAPTNKATGVLSSFLRMPCKTIYSLLGFRMEANEDKLELTAADFEKLPMLPRGSVICIDEAGMLQAMLVKLMERLATERGWRFLCVGDPYQLNPVGERTSKVWKLTSDPACRAMMTEVKRFDNQLLKLSINIREAIKARDFKHSPVVVDNDGTEGVWTWSKQKTLTFLKSRDLAFWRRNKVAAWRNKTVNEYNDLIRKSLGFVNKFEPGEAILIGSPVIEEGRIIAHTDEELEVGDVIKTTVKLGEDRVACDELVIVDRNYRLVIPTDREGFQAIMGNLAADARAAAPKKRMEAWAKFWEAKAKVHDARYGYAMTAHRLQGSTVEGMYADQSDVLSNPEKLEAFRMLYVLATRPSQKLVAF